MSASRIAACIFVATSAFTGGVARAQSAAVLGRSDADFAQALLSNGYTDLAEKLCTLLQSQGNLPPEEAASVKALHLDLRLDLAMREADLIKRKDLLATILQEKEDIVRSYAGRKVAQDTAATLPDVYQRLGETISRAIQAEKDPGLIAQLQKEGADIFKAAEEKLEGRIADLKDAISESTTAQPKLENELIAALFNLPKTRYYHALLFGKSDTTSRDVHLDQAILGFQEFQLDYGDTLFGYQALVYEGLAHKEKEAWKDAENAFDDAIGLREGYDLDSKGVYAQMGPYEADLVSWAVLQKVLMLTERNRVPEAIAESRNYFDTTPTPDEARYGLGLRAALADAYLKAGDMKAAADQADKLVEADPRGPWGATGREIQGRLLQSGGPVDPEKVLRIAQTLLERGDSEQAVRVAHQAIAAIGKDPKMASVGVEAWLLIGTTFLGRQWEHEAALAFDASEERFGAGVERTPVAERAAEAIYQSMRIYSRLAKAEKKTFYATRAADRQKTLSSKYANTQRGEEGAMFEGQALADEEKYVEAAEFYGRVPPTAPTYLEAQFRAGESYFFHVANLFKADPKSPEGKTFGQQAETLMKKAMSEADLAYGKTMDLSAKARFDSIGRRARIRLAELYLTTGIDRPAEVMSLLDSVDERFPQDAARFWGFRIAALRKQGKLDEAITLLDALTVKDPDSKAIGPAAGNLARALDERADELRDKEKKPKEAEALRRKAATFYASEGRGLLLADPIKVSAVELTAGRLFTLGLIANEVPESQQTFVGWDPAKNKETANWTLCADLLTRALEVQPGYLMQVTAARAHGFLGDYKRAADVLGALFDAEPIYDTTKKALNRKLLKSKPELFNSYLEWGVAEHLVAQKDQDADRFRRAQVILTAMTKNLDPMSRNWWYVKYYEIANMYASGAYGDACFGINDLERTTDSAKGLGQEFGLNDEFAQLKDQLKDKCK